MKFSVIGAGSWGTAFARYLALQGHEVLLYGRRREQVEDLKKRRENRNYLPGILLPEQIRYSSDLEEALAAGENILCAISSQQVRPFFSSLTSMISPHQRIINLSKGIEIDTLCTMSQVFAEILPDNSFVSLSGPSHAEEVARDLPTVLVAVSKEEAVSRLMQRISSESLRIYRSDDLIGVESGAALKNVIALAVGISDGVGFGDNTRAAIMTRGMSEILRLGLAMGARLETYLGLSGFGDLIVTCTSQHSRNRHCGELIGRGFSLEEALQEVGMVVEGISTLESACQLADRYDIEMPITRTLHGVIHQAIDLEEAVWQLMGRDYKKEFDYE